MAEEQFGISGQLEFVPPLWLEAQDAETIHERMMQALPDDIDDTEGGFPWDFTKPTALEKAELLEYHMMETLKIMHYMFAYGVYLDYHAKAYGLTRKAASPASGILQITGSPGAVIPKGFLFAVPAAGDSEAITFFTTEETQIGFNGKVEIPIQASEDGQSGNVAADTIVIMASPTISGIESITNHDATTGGTAEEDDESLRQRIKEICESADKSFVGCDADYKRWAKECEGVGDVIIMPEWAGAGTVKVVLLDSNGQPANQKIVEAVFDYIVSPNDRDRRKAPIGATVTVAAPTTVTINISCTLSIAESESRSEIIEKIKEGIKRYFDSVQKEAQQQSQKANIKRNRIGSIIIGTDGVADYANLKLNGAAENIRLARDERPTVGSFTAESGV